MKVWSWVEEDPEFMVPVIKSTVAALLLILLFSAIIFVGWAMIVHTVWSFAVWGVIGPWAAWYMGVERGRMETCP